MNIYCRGIANVGNGAGGFFELGWEVSCKTSSSAVVEVVCFRKMVSMLRLSVSLPRS